jgi:hypothetical protein
MGAMWLVIGRPQFSYLEPWGFALFIYLFICHDSMQPGSYGPLEKQIKCLERERANNLEVMPSSAMNKCKMQK